MFNQASRFLPVMLVLLAGLVLRGSEFQVYHYCNFDDPELNFRDALSCPLAAGSQEQSSSPFFLVRTRSVAGERVRLPLQWITGADAFNGRGRSLSFPPTPELHVAMQLEHLGDIPSQPGMFVALQVFVPADGPTSFTFNTWNYENKVNRYVPVRVIPGQWNYLKFAINGTHFLPDGNIFRYFTFYNDNWPRERNFYLDEVAVWRGVNPRAVVPVEQLSVRSEASGNHLSWQPPGKHPLPIVSYEIYRGTVPDFPLQASTLIKRTSALSYFDQYLLRDGYYYQVLARDCSAD